MQLEDASPLDREAAAWIRDKLASRLAASTQDRVLREAAACGIGHRRADSRPRPLPFPVRLRLPQRDPGRRRPPAVRRFRICRLGRPGQDGLRFPLPAANCPCRSEHAAPLHARPWFPGCRTRRCISSGSSCCCDVYRLKWCCIMLNEFLPVAGQRRNFAQDAGGARRSGNGCKLEKAEQALQRIEQTITVYRDGQKELKQVYDQHGLRRFSFHGPQEHQARLRGAGHRVPQGRSRQAGQEMGRRLLGRRPQDRLRRLPLRRPLAEGGRRHGPALRHQAGRPHPRRRLRQGLHPLRFHPGRAGRGGRRHRRLHATPSSTPRKRSSRASRWPAPPNCLSRTRASTW